MSLRPHFFFGYRVHIDEVYHSLTRQPLGFTHVRFFGLMIGRLHLGMTLYDRKAY